MKQEYEIFRHNYRSYTATTSALNAIGFEHDEWELDLLKRINYTNRIVDVGCGHGRLFGLFNDIFPHSCLYAIERDTRMANIARKRATQINPLYQVINADIFEYDFDKLTADLVVMLGFTIGGFFGIAEHLKLIGNISNLLFRMDGVWCVDVLSEECGNVENVISSHKK